MDIQVLEIAYHRNGISGTPFYAVRFRDLTDSLLMVAAVFEGEDDGAVAVFDAAQVAETVAFGQNSWRGDRYAPALRKAIAAWEDVHARGEKPAKNWTVRG